MQSAAKTQKFLEVYNHERVVLAAGRWTGKEVNLANSKRSQKFEAQKFEVGVGLALPREISAYKLIAV